MGEFVGWVVEIAAPEVEVAVVIEVMIVVKVIVDRFIEVWVRGELCHGPSCKHLAMTVLLPLVTRC